MCVLILWSLLEVEHVRKVLHYKNYPQWLIDKWGKSDQSGPLIHPDTGHEIKKQFFVSIPYFPGFSESFKRSSSTPLYRFVSRGRTPSNPCLCTPKTRSPQTKRRILSTIGNARQMGVSPPTLKKLLELLYRGSRNIVSLPSQPYSNTVLIFTTPYHLYPTPT